MKVAAAFAETRTVFLDTAPIVYLLELHPKYGPIMLEFQRFRAAAGVSLVTSPVTLVECLVHPLRQGRTELAEAYRRLIVEAEDTSLCAIDADVAALAAQLRAQHNLRFADALQVAVALRANCQAILTNDAAFNRVREPCVIQVANLEM